MDDRQRQIIAYFNSLSEPVPPPPTVTGMRLAPVEPVQPPRPTLATAALGLLLAAITAAGALRQRLRALVPSH